MSFIRKYRLWIIILLIVVGVIGGLWAVYIKVMENMWPTTVLVGERARIRVNEIVISLPPSVTDIYWYEQAQMDAAHYYLAFSGPRDVLDKTVEQLTGKKLTDLVPWKGQIHRDDNLYGPDAGDPENKKYKTKLYDLDDVKDGLFYQDEAGFHVVIYDRKKGRVYASCE